jgi:hypothetical protein
MQMRMTQQEKTTATDQMLAILSQTDSVQEEKMKMTHPAEGSGRMILSTEHQLT